MLHDVVFLATCLATLEKEIHCKWQKTCYKVQSPAATCKFKTNSMQSLQKVEPSCTLCDCCKPKMLQDKLQRWHVRCSNLPAAFLATPLQHKLQRKLHLLTLAVKLDSTSCNDCRNFLEPLQVAAQDCNVYYVSCNLQRIFFSTLRDKLQGKLHHVTLA